jgi:S1-C subfamily serine protease
VSGWDRRPTLPASPPLREPPSLAPTPPTIPVSPVAVPPPLRPARAPAAFLVLVGVLSALVAALVSGVLVLALGDRGSGRDAPGAGGRLAGPTLDIHALLTKAQPSVVALRTGDDSSIYGGAGSGVIISDDGDVLTNAHVVGGAGTVQVRLHDGREVTADLVGSFPDADIALVRLRDTSGLTPAELGSSADARVGDDVVAIGNALNLGGLPSVTVGILSAKDRVIETPEITLANLLQTDAAINPGNSGGPLLNARGQVIGINTAIIGDAQNIGFAIPVDVIRPLIEDLRRGNGTITPDDAFLGVVTVDVADLPPDLLDEYRISASRGAVITEVTEGTAAADVALQIGDVVVSVDGERVEASTDLGELIRRHRPGDEVTIGFEREGRKREVTVRLGARGG